MQGDSDPAAPDVSVNRIETMRSRKTSQDGLNNYITSLYKHRLLLIGLAPVVVLLVFSLTGRPLPFVGSSRVKGKVHHGMNVPILATNNPIDDFVTSQTDWATFPGLIRQHNQLSTNIEAGKEHMMDLLTSIDGSDLLGRDRLSHEISNFIAISSRVVDALRILQAVAHSAVNSIQFMNHHIYAGCRVAYCKAPCMLGAGPSYVVYHGMFSGGPEPPTWPTFRQLQRRLMREAENVHRRLQKLDDSGSSLVADLGQLERHLGNMVAAGLAEERRLQPEAREFLREISEHLGIHGSWNAPLPGVRGRTLRTMAEAVQEGTDCVAKMMARIERLKAEFATLQRGLAGRQLQEQSDMIAQQILTKAAIARLDAALSSAGFPPVPRDPIYVAMGETSEPQYGARQLPLAELEPHAHEAMIRGIRALPHEASNGH